MRAVKWSALGELLTRTVQPVMLLVLAKLLTPEEFGIVGVAMIAIGLAQIFQEFGVGKALIQARSEVDTHASNAFWLNTGIAIVIYAAVFIFARPIALFFKSPGSAEVLRVLGLQIVLTSLVSVQLARLQREIRYRAFLVVRFLPTLVTGALAIGLAFRGHGVWSIVWGALAGAVLQVVLGWTASAWRPRLRFDWIEFTRMFAFSKWVLLESALAWLVSWGDSIALGHFLGPEALGLYRMGSVVVAYLSNILFTPIVPVAFGLLARLQDDRAAFVDSFGKLTRMVVLVSLPIGVGAALVGDAATIVVLGAQWAAAGIVVQLMGLRMGLEWLVGLSSTAFTAIGRPAANVRILTIAVVISVPVYVVAAPHGLWVFCAARLAASQLTNVFAHRIARSILTLPKLFLWERVKSPLAACAVMAAAVFGLGWLFSGTSAGGLIASVVLGAAAYVGALGLIDRAALSWGANALRQIFARKGAGFSST